MECSANIEFTFPSAKEAADAAVVLGRESGTKRSGAEVFAHGKSLSIKICAGDPVAFRALINSYLRQLKVIEGINGV